MGMLFVLTTPSTASACYHDVAFQYDPLAKTYSAQVMSYISKDAKVGGAMPLATKGYRDVPGIDSTQPIFPQIYAYIMAKPEWAGATVG